VQPGRTADAAWPLFAAGISPDAWNPAKAVNLNSYWIRKR